MNLILFDGAAELEELIQMRRLEEALDLLRELRQVRGLIEPREFMQLKRLEEALDQLRKVNVLVELEE